MAVLSTLALRPDHPDANDVANVFVIEGEKFVAFGTMSAEQFWSRLPLRRYIHPSLRQFSLLLDWSLPKNPQDIFIVVDTPGSGDSNSDPLKFVLEDRDEPALEFLPGGGCAIARSWQDRFLDLQGRLERICQELLDEFPRAGLIDDGSGLLAFATDDTVTDMVRTLESGAEAGELLWTLKGMARNNLGVLSWIVHLQPWWERALQEDDRAFVLSLNLRARPKRGCVINLLSDWSHINIPLLLELDIPFAYVWSEAVNASPRFSRLDSTVVNGYYWMRRELGREPEAREIPALVNGENNVLRYDHLLQDKEARTQGSHIPPFDPRKTYLLQMHEGWKGTIITNPATILRCLETYECYEKDPGDGAQYVVMEGWSLRGKDNKSAEATHENGFVVSQSSDGEGLGERADLTVYQRRELYRLGCAPWGGASYDPVTGEAQTLVDLEKKSALVELERLLYPSTPALDDSVGPPELNEHSGSETMGADLLSRLSDVSSSRASEAPSPAASSSSLLRRLGLAAPQVATPPPSTHSSWRTERASDISLDGGRRSASPRRGVRLPAEPINLAMPDPTSYDRRNLAVPSSPNWAQRLRLFRASFQPLLRTLSPRPYPRIDDDFFDVQWLQDFIKYGYLHIPNAADRLRVLLWLETQGFQDPRELLQMCLVAGIRCYVGYRTDAPLPAYAQDVVGPQPNLLEGDYLDFEDGGRQLYNSYKGMVEGLCRREHAVSFLFYGGLVSAIAAHYGKSILRGRVGEGVDLVTRVYKLDGVEHPYGLENEIAVEKPRSVEINKLLGMVRGRTDRDKFFWLYPPEPLWASFWKGSGEWNIEEEDYFQDLVDELESGKRGAKTMRQWSDHLEGLAHVMERRHPDRAQPGLDTARARYWIRLFDLVYGVEDETLALDGLTQAFGPKRIPLFR